ncbi:MAG: ATP-binding cassette domain-containing protein [Solirubrobacterales bacterium]|nr:ATP-binding cassette domain-containing protein [Solirubrobacterales bacterium]
MIELTGAAVRLGGKRVFSDVELKVGSGQLVAVLGPNGAGKSTLMRVILGLIRLEAGSVTVLGGPPAQARGAIGYLPQRRGFDASTRIRGVDLVRLGIDGARWGLPLALTRSARARQRGEVARVREVIELVDAQSYAQRPIGELSGGEQQRLLIAQALVRAPRLLILDEPLDSLDLPNQAAVAGLLRRICSAENVSVLLVAHDVNPLLPYLDQVIYMAGGHARSGRAEEVISSATLSELYGAPIEVLQTQDGRLVVVGQPDASHHHAPRHALAT